MAAEQKASFGPFSLYGRCGPLFHGKDEISLSPKALALLWTLVRQAGRVLTKSELFSAVWPGQEISEAALNFQIHELRQALGDNTRKPKYIATQHRVGFRFVAKVEQAEQPSLGPALLRPFVGRESELEHLNKALASAAAGQLQTVFVTGEAGVGKTRLVDQFLSHSQGKQPGLMVGRGQCVEFHGASEPFLPVLEALGRLLRQPQATEHVKTLERYAPNWLIQLPALLDEGEVEALAQRISGSARERLFRELTEVLEQISKDQPLILVLEDLHWADMSTIEAIKRLAATGTQGRLLILCTYRSLQAELDEHAIKLLKLELVGRNRASGLSLADLQPGEVQQYLSERLPKQSGNMEEITANVYRQTGGQPLILAHVCDRLAEQLDAGTQASLELINQVPPRLRDLLERELAELEPLDRHLLEAASVVGQQFAAATVAAALEVDPEEIEKRCQKLIRYGQFIAESGLAIWPDGTTSGSYHFTHALYGQALREKLSSVQHAQLARRIANRLEVAYHERSGPITAELAGYFEIAGMTEKALRYQIDTARRVLATQALDEGWAKLAKCEQLLAALPDTPSRLPTRFTLAILRVNTIYIESGYTSPKLDTDLGYLRSHLDEINDPELESIALTLLWRYESYRARLNAAEQLSERLIQLGRRVNNPFIECTGLARTALVYHITGRPKEAEALSSQAVSIAATRINHDWGDTNVDPGIAAIICNAASQWFLGRPDTALQLAQQSIDRAIGMDNPYMECAARGMILTTILAYRRDFAELLKVTTRAMALSQEYGHRESLGWGMKMQGIAKAMTGQPDEGLAMLRQVIAAQRAAGSELLLTLDYAHEAEACLLAGRNSEAHTALEQAFDLMQGSGERLWQPELWRIRAELLLAEKRPQTGKAEACYDTALRLAQERSAHSLELRAAIGLAGLWQRRKHHRKAKELLHEVCGRFVEGQDSSDMIAARELLVAL
ncbi:MAG: AAA family ATPase [Nevskiales bacterium]